MATDNTLMLVSRGDLYTIQTMTSLPPDADPNSLVDRNQETVNKTRSVLDKLAESIRRSLIALDNLPGEHKHATDPERLGRLETSLFQTADVLIFLAEDVRGVRLRKERAAKAEVAPQAITLGDQEVLLTADEASLLKILQDQEGEPLLAVDILDLGFGQDVSGDRETRKQLLTKTLTKLNASLEAYGIAGLFQKSGKARGTRYALLTAPFAPSDDTALVEEVPQDVISQPPIEPIAVRRREPTEQAMVTQRVQQSVTDIIEATSRPIFGVRELLARSYGEERLSPEKFELVKQAARADSRVRYAGRGEYVIVGRADQQDWIDRTLLEKSVDDFVTQSVRSRFTYVTLNRIYRKLEETDIFVTLEEKVLITELLSQDPRIERVDEHSAYLRQASPAPELPGPEQPTVASEPLDVKLARLNFGVPRPTFKPKNSHRKGRK